MTAPPAASPASRLRARLRPQAAWLVGLLARRRPRGGDAGGGPPRILVMTYDQRLGSIMAMTPLLAALRAAQPAARVTVVGTALLAETLRADPAIDRLAGHPDPSRSWASTLWHCARAMATRRARFDWVITTEGSRDQVRAGLLATCLPARRRAGLAAATVLRHYHHAVRYDRDASMVVNNLRAAAPLGVAPAAREPRLYFDRRALARVRRWLAADGADEARPLVVFAVQVSGGQPTAWHEDRVAAVAESLAARHGAQPVFVGTAAAQPQIDRIRRMTRARALSLAGRTGIADLAALLAFADLAIVLDSGPLHVARGVGVPLVLVASGWQPPHHWLPDAAAHRAIIAPPYVCPPPCRRGACAAPTCMAGITAASVAEAATAILRRFPPVVGRAARVAGRLADDRRRPAEFRSFWAAITAR